MIAEEVQNQQTALAYSYREGVEGRVDFENETVELDIPVPEGSGLDTHLRYEKVLGLKIKYRGNKVFQGNTYLYNDTKINVKGFNRGFFVYLTNHSYKTNFIFQVFFCSSSAVLERHQTNLVTLGRDEENKQRICFPVINNVRENVPAQVVIDEWLNPHLDVVQN